MKRPQISHSQKLQYQTSTIKVPYLFSNNGSHYLIVRKSEHRFRTALLRYEWHWYEYEPYDTIRIPDSLDFVNFEVLTISRLTCRTETKEQRKYGKELKQLEMWANAQPDGRPAEYRWRPLFNAAKFG